MRIRLEQSGDANTIQTGTTQANSAADLRITSIGTSGTTYMTISTTGNIGIGTTSPSQRLDVVGGSLRITGGSLLATHNSNTIGSLFTTGGNIGIGTTAPVQLNGSLLNVQNSTVGNYISNAIFNCPNISTNTLISPINVGRSLSVNNMAEIRFGYVGDGSSSNYIGLSHNGVATTPFIVNAAGNVGIGTSSPLSLLHMRGGNSCGTLLFSNTGNNSGFRPAIQISYNTAALEGGSGQFKVLEAYTGLNPGTGEYDDQSDLRLYTNNAIRMYINRLGNVGIGTSSPANKLHVSPGLIRLSRVNNTAQNWDIQADSDANLWFYFEGAPKGYLAWSADVGQIDFTGQHRSKSETVTDITDKVGYIVHSTGQFDNMSGNSSPTINESIPVVSLTSTINDKAVFGVISDIESDSTVREYSIGSFVSATEKEVGDQRLIINSVGEGAIWVCNANGNIENGDYITSCQVPGLGMCQADDILHNYTVAKATCSVVFSDLTQLQSKYQTRFLQEDGTIITEQEYNSMLANNEAVYIAAFIGCTYHCG